MRPRATSLPSPQRGLLFAPRCACENLSRHFHVVGHNYGHRLAESDARVANRRKRLFRFIREHPENAPGMEVENLTDENEPVAIKARGWVSSSITEDGRYPPISPKRTAFRWRKENIDNMFAGVVGKYPANKTPKCIFLEIPRVSETNSFERPLVRLGPATYLPPSVRHQYSKSHHISDKLDQSTITWLKQIIDPQTPEQGTTRFQFIITPPFVNEEMAQYEVKGTCADRTFTINIIIQGACGDIPSSRTEEVYISDEKNIHLSSLNATLPSIFERDDVSSPGNSSFQGSHWDILNTAKPASLNRRKILTEIQRREIEGPEETIRRWKENATKEARKMNELRAKERMAKKNNEIIEWSSTSCSVEDTMIKFAEALKVRRAREARRSKIHKTITAEDQQVATLAQDITPENFNTAKRNGEGVAYHEALWNTYSSALPDSPLPY